MSYVDLHIHSTASDGTLSFMELFPLLYEKGIHSYSITDHDTVEGTKEALAFTPEGTGLRVISGVELTSRYSGAEVFNLHILGYGFDPYSPIIASLIDYARNMRVFKHVMRLQYLNDRFDIVFTEEEEEYLNTRLSVGRVHIAELLLRRGLCLTVRDGIERYLSGPDFPEGCVDADIAISSIINAGGIAVYAHPLGGENELRLSFAEVERRVKLLKEIGIGGLECYYSRYSEEEIAFLKSLAEKYGLYVSGGSDFHGENKTVELGNLSSTGCRATAWDIDIIQGLTNL